MYVITELGDQAILSYPAGDMMVFCNEELARAHSVVISANNNGVWQIASLFDTRIQYWQRIVVDGHNPLKVRAVKFTKYPTVITE